MDDFRDTHLLRVVVVSDAAVARVALSSVGAVALPERVAAVEVVFAEVREGEGSGVVITATAASSTAAVNTAHVVDHHVHVDAKEDILL